LNVLEKALSKAHRDPTAFSDGEELNWTQDEHARVLFALGRTDEAFTALHAGAAMMESGTVNVSQAINLADAYDLYDRPSEALDAVAGIDLGAVSAYGRMALLDAKACAYYALGDRPNLATVVTQMRAHASEGQQPYLNTMMCTDDRDGA